jgi:hypothetical protein
MSTLCDEQKALKGCFSSWPGGGREEPIRMTVAIKVIFCFGHGILTRYAYKKYVASCIAAQSPGLKNGAACTITSSQPIGIRLPRHLLIRTVFHHHRNCTFSESHSRVESPPSIPFDGVRHLTAGRTSLLSILVIVGSNCIVWRYQM